MLFSAIDAALVVIEFSRMNVDYGVVDSPPSQGPWRLPILSASPLEGCHCIGSRHCSPSLGPPPLRTLHRELYKHCMDEVFVHASVQLHVHCSSALSCVCVHATRSRCTTLDHL